MDPARARATGLAVRGERIAAIGNDDEVGAAGGPNSRLIDLAGQTVIPGLIDTHAHMDREGLRRFYPSLRECRSIADVQAVVRREAAKRPSGEWIVLLPLGEPPFHMQQAELLAERRFPDRRDLDAAAPDHPVLIRAPWGYWSNRPPFVHVLNSAALQRCGIGRGATSPHRPVQVELDGDGEPTGRVLESHFSSIAEYGVLAGTPRVTPTLRRRALLDAMRLSAAAGTTAVYEGHGVADELRETYADLHASGEQTVRAYLSLALPPWRSTADVDRFAAEASRIAGDRGHGDAMLTLGGVFLAYGGDDDVRAACDAAWPYTGWAAFKEQAVAPDEYAELCRILARHRLRVGTIVGGAAASTDTLDRVLSVWESVDREYPIRDLRWVLVHTALLDVARDAPRVRGLGAVITTQPSSYLHRSGLDAVRRGVAPADLMPYRDWTSERLHWALSTDNKPYDMFFTIWTAMARREMTRGEIIGPAQRIGFDDALRAATLDGAYASFAERDRGSLEVGKLADLVVLADDPSKMAPDAAKDMRPVATLIGGRVASDSEGLFGP
jgi:predicted amidohydrolase YtcJ